MQILLKDASKKEDKTFRGVAHIISLAQRMLSVDPLERPSATFVQERLYVILTDICGMGQGDSKRGRVHCETRKLAPNIGLWNIGFEDMRLASQRAAAEACANVNVAMQLAGGQKTDLALGNGGVIYGVERLAQVVSRGSEMASSSGFGKEGTGGLSRITSAGTDAGGDAGDRRSTYTKTSGSKSEGKSSSGKQGAGKEKVKPKVKAWQAPVYAELSFG